MKIFLKKTIVFYLFILLFFLIIFYVWGDIIVEEIFDDTEMFRLGNISDTENGGNSSDLNNAINNNPENNLPTQDIYDVNNLEDGAIDFIIRPQEGNSNPTQNQFPEDFGNNNDPFGGLGGNDPQAEAEIIIGPL